MYDETMNQEDMQAIETRNGLAPEMKLGGYFCLFAFALATVIYLLC